MLALSCSDRVREQFRAKYSRAKNKQTLLGLHGTSLDNSISIFENGFNRKCRRVVFGYDGDYFTSDVQV